MNFAQISFRNGVGAGVLTILYLLVFYFIDKRLMLSPQVYWSSMLIYIFFMVRCAKMTINTPDRTILFKDLLTNLFFTFVVANVIYNIFYVLLASVFDRSLLDIQKELALEMLNWQKTQVNDPNLLKNFDQAIQETATSSPSFSFKDLLFGFARGTIGGFVLSAILSAFYLKRY